LTGRPELHRRCFAIDGGEGGALLAELERSSSFERVYSPRHADTLLVFGPLSRKLVPAARQLARAVPRPASALVVADASELLPGLRPFEPREVQFALAGELPELNVADGPEPEPTELNLPDRKELEIATEIVVHSLGPIQAFTDGPLRVLLACDGEQVLFARIEAGFASRGLAEAMKGTTKEEALRLAERIVPGSPAAGRLALLRELDRERSSPEHALLAAELATQSAAATLRWTHRLFSAMAWPAREREAADLVASADRNGGLAESIGRWAAKLGRDRLLRLRTAGVGRVPEDLDSPAAARELIGAPGEDVRGRLLRRLLIAARRLRQPADSNAVHSSRGPLRVRAGVSDGRIANVTWETPTAATLPFVPRLLQGHRLADAEVVLASLDLCAAEADP